MWNPRDLYRHIPDLITLFRGEISNVSHPKYIFIRANDKLIPVKYWNAQLDKNNK